VKGVTGVLAFLLFGAAVVAPARAVTFDWSTVSWMPGATSGSFDIDPSNPGNDITIEITGDTFHFDPTNPAIGTTALNGLANTGGTGQAGLQMGLDFGAGTTSVTVTVTFHYAQGVNATFNLWDVDREDSTRDNNKTVDRISNIFGSVAGGGTVAASSVTTGLAISQTGTGQAAVYSGSLPTADSPNGTLGVAFTDSPVTSISLTYDPGTPSNSGAQWIALSNIDFTTPVPETGASLGALSLCLGMLLVSRIRQRVPMPCAQG